MSGFTDSLGAMRELRVLPCGGKLVGHCWNLSWRLWVVTCDSIASQNVEILIRDGYVSRWTPCNLTRMCLNPKKTPKPLFQFHVFIPWWAWGHVSQMCVCTCFSSFVFSPLWAWCIVITEIGHQEPWCRDFCHKSTLLLHKTHEY